MSPPSAADDVSADAEMMLFAIAHNDAMFAPMRTPKPRKRGLGNPTRPAGHIIAAGNIMCEARIICPSGQTSLKKAA